MKSRRDQDPPAVTSVKSYKYHHLGIPTREIKPDEIYLEEYKMYVSGFHTSEYGIEWMRFEEDSPISDIIKRIPHIAFEVDNLEKAIEGKEMIGPITSPSEGIRVAMILENGAPIELMQFNKKN